jgi:hypothetical protein
MAELTFALALGVLAGLVPGAALLCRLRFTPRSRIDGLLATVAVSVTATGTAVHLLLLCGAYTPWTAAALLGLPAAYLLALAWRGDARLRGLWHGASAEAADRPPSRLDRAALGACAALLLACFVAALSSPPTLWDGIMTWNRWANDWGRRRDVHGYLFGYPQLLPMFSSIVYKLTGAHRELLPPATFALHALHPLLGTALLLAVWRLARLLGVPAWAALLGVFGAEALREQLASGTADLLVTTLSAVGVALYLAPLRGARGHRGADLIVVGIVLFGAVAAKTSGLVASLTVLCVHLSYRRWLPAGITRPGLASGAAVVAAALPALLYAPFLLQQFHAAATTPARAVDPTGVNFRITDVLGVLLSVTASTHVDQTMVERLSSTWGVAPRFADVTGALLIVAGAGACLERRTRPLIGPVLVHLAIWSRTLSYDLRNLLPSLPLLVLALAGGGAALGRLAGGRAPARQRLFAWGLGLALVPPALGLGREIGALVTILGGEGQGLGVRLRALRDGLDARVRLFFPGDYADYVFVRDLDLPRRGARLIAASNLYRFFPNASYPLTTPFDWGRYRAGDVYVALDPWRPPGSQERWTTVRPRRPATQLTLVYTPTARAVPPASLRLTGVSPPVLRRAGDGFAVVRFSGPQSLVAYDALSDRPPPGAWIVWRLVGRTTAAPGEIRPFHLAYDPAVVDARVSTVVAEGPAEEGGSVTWSGLLVLRADHPLSTRPEDGLFVGVLSERPGTHLRITAFTLSIIPPATDATRVAGR